MLLARVLRASTITTSLQAPAKALLCVATASSSSRRTISSTPSRARRPIGLPVGPKPSSTPTDPNAPIVYEPLQRHVPARRGVLLITLPIPPTSWPSHLEVLSPLIADASAELKSKGLAVYAVYDGVGHAAFPALGEEETYEATLVYPDGRRFAFPAFNAQVLKDDPLFRKGGEYRPLDVSRAGVNALPVARGAPEVLVCTHGSRDCRCSDRGGELVTALRAELERRGVKGVRVREVAHVGGHKWAANALLIPALDMLSNLAATDAPALAAHLLTNRPPSSPMWRHWRGRVGLSEADQARLWARIEAGLVASEPPAQQAAELADPAVATEAPHPGTPAAPQATVAVETVPITFRHAGGPLRTVPAALGASLLDVAHAHKLPGMEGTCGGNAECATCHVYLAPNGKGADAPVPEPSDEELDMLEFAIDYNDETSRLGCQVQVTKELARWVEEGGVVDLPRF